MGQYLCTPHIVLLSLGVPCVRWIYVKVPGISIFLYYLELSSKKEIKKKQGISMHCATLEL